MTKKALKLQLSDNEVSDKVTKNSKSYLLEQQILADGYNREITSASKRQEGTSPKETIMFKKREVGTRAPFIHRTKKSFNFPKELSSIL